MAMPWPLFWRWTEAAARQRLAVLHGESGAPHTAELNRIIEEWRLGETVSERPMYQEDPPPWPDRIPQWRRWLAKIRCWIRKVKAHGARKPE